MPAPVLALRVVLGMLALTAPAAGARLAAQSVEPSTEAELVEDLLPGPDSSTPYSLGRRVDDVVFLARPTPERLLPWRSDATAPATRPLTDRGSLLQHSLTAPKLYANGTTTLYQPGWVVGLGPPSTPLSLLGNDPDDEILLVGLLADIPFSAVSLGDHTWFAASRDDTGTELFVTDGSAEGTRLFADASPGTTEAGAPLESDPQQLTLFEGRLYFTASPASPPHDRRTVWSAALDGSRLAPVEGALFGNEPEHLIATRERLFIVFPGPSMLTVERGSDDATPAETESPDAPVPAARSRGAVASRGRLALALQAAPGLELPPTGERSLWLTDGSAGVRLFGLEDTSAEDDWHVTAVGDLLYLTPATEEHGQELWVSDGTPDGTRLLADLAPGPESSTPHHLRAVDGQLLFAASTPATGSELWATDGTPGGTRLLVDLAAAQHSGDPSEPTPLGDRILFAGHRDDVGRELFSFDRRELEPSCSTEPVTGSVCLGDERFRVSVDWLDRVSGQRGRATGSQLTRDTASFWFFEEDNVELLVKVLDGRGINDAHWVYTGAVSDVAYWVTVFDTVAGESVTYENQQGSQCGVGDVGALPEDAERAGLFGLLGPLPPADPPVSGEGNASETCVPTDTRLCLQDGRFAVEVDWESPLAAPVEGRGHAVPATADSGYFWFFSPENVELVVKVLDARAINAHYWVYTGALSDVAYTVKVTDTLTGAVRTYDNAEGIQCGQGDVEAFPAEDDTAECAPPREVAISPRADRLAEELAAYYGPRAWAEDPLYDRVAGDLEAIRDAEPAIEDFPFFSPGYELGAVGLLVDTPTRDAILAGQYDAWNCPNQRYRMEVTAYDFSHAVVVRSQAVLDPRPLEGLYATLPGVEDTFLNGLGTVPECSIPRACLEREGGLDSVFTYYFQNDRCVLPFPESPPVHRFRLAAGEVLDAESWTPGDQPRPEWVDDFEACLLEQQEDLN
jgi:ELWxxDGT repeat protein